MTSNDSPEATLIRRLCRRLDEAVQLSEQVRDALQAADESTIHQATARLSTIATEYKVIAAEVGRARSTPSDIANPALEQARAELEQSALGAMRSAAITGGLLQRLVEMSRKLIDTLSAEQGRGYLPSGRQAEGEFGGMRLKEQA